MQGDFSSWFKSNREKNYNSVLMQQGRVILDADWNEQVDIQKHIRETEAIDVVGRCGAPIDIAGFKVEVAPGGRDLTLSSGRMYLDGILCELEGHLGYFEDVLFPSENQAKLSTLNIDDMALEEGQWIEISVKDDLQHQVLRIEEIDDEELILTFNEMVNEDLSEEAASSGIYIKIFFKIEDRPDINVGAPGTYLAHLDVWDRHITAVEDDDIREKALGGPDTATRVKTEWRVKLMPCDLEKISCLEASLKLKDLTDPGDSRLAVRLQPAQKESAKDPCEVLSGAAYRGLENQLYRVEIHEPGEVGEATFKWSQNNGAIAFAIVDFIPDESEDDESEIDDSDDEFHKLKLRQLGWDQELRIHKDDWVEVLGDETELLGLPGTLARVEDIDEADLILTLTADVAKHVNESNPKVRRWDLNESGLEESLLINGIPTEAASEDETDSKDDGWIELEDGIEVSFKAGDIYRTGDFWLIPARNSGEIEWPHEENDFVPKFGIQHHNCLLAILNRNQEGTWSLEKDCRKLFPPLTDMVFLSYVGGEGQEGMPGEELPSPLQVRVHRGGRPFEGAEVNFEIVKGKGKIREKPEDVYVDGPITVTTDGDGIARCLWEFGDDQPDGDLIWIEQVKATLLYPGQEHPPSIQFNANASAASLSYVGGDGQDAMPGKELPAPLQARVFVGGYPLKNAKVEFEIVKGKGKIREKPDDDYVAGPITVTTESDGIARCLWEFGDDQPEDGLIWIERVKATLLYPEMEHPPSIQFNANASAASLSYVGGDGQEAMPGEELPAPLQARVFVGGYPLKNAEVEFRIAKGGGELREAGGVFSGQNNVTFITGEDGIATCFWKFGDDRPQADLVWIEQVEATLINPKQEHSPSTLFSATAIPLSLSYVGGDGQEAMPGDWLPAPLQVRASRGERPVEGAKITFEIIEGQGVLDPAGGPVLTGMDGIAQCICRFEEVLESPCLRVRAMLIDIVSPDENGNPSHPSIIFNANTSVAEEVAYSPPRECLQLDGVETVRDAINGLCRQVSFSCVGGDGQEAMPGYELPGPFRVRVARGSYPVTGAKVKFKIEPEKGQLRETSGGTGGDELEVSTDENGIATCFCKLDENAAIEAKLIEPTPTDQSPITFNANTSMAEEVAYSPPGECLQLDGVETVRDAINGLCRQVSFSCVGGDGQETMPGTELPGPFRVRVARGSYPVTGAKVKFKIEPEKGELRKDNGETGEELDVPTDDDGIATCFCSRLDENAAIEAKLMAPTPTDQSPLLFYANVSVAGQVAYDPVSCPHLSRARTVQAAIDGLCRIIPVEASRLIEASRPAKASRVVWVHGNSLQVERLEGEISVKRENDGTLVELTEGSKARMHFSIPTTTAIGGSSFTQADEVLLRLKCSDKDFVIDVSIYDGEKLIRDAEVPAQDNWETIHIRPIDVPISTGLGISIQVEGINEDRRIKFSAAGCQFSAKQ